MEIESDLGIDLFKTEPSIEREGKVFKSEFSIVKPEPFIKIESRIAKTEDDIVKYERGILKVQDSLANAGSNSSRHKRSRPSIEDDESEEVDNVVARSSVLLSSQPAARDTLRDISQLTIQSLIDGIEVKIPGARNVITSRLNQRELDVRAGSYHHLRCCLPHQSCDNRIVEANGIVNHQANSKCGFCASFAANQSCRPSNAPTNPCFRCRADHLVCLRPADVVDLCRKLKEQCSLQKLTGKPYQKLLGWLTIGKNPCAPLLLFLTFVIGSSETKLYRMRYLKDVAFVD